MVYPQIYKTSRSIKCSSFFSNSNTHIVDHRKNLSSLIREMENRVYHLLDSRGCAITPEWFHGHASYAFGTDTDDIMQGNFTPSQRDQANLLPNSSRTMCRTFVSLSSKRDTFAFRKSFEEDIVINRIKMSLDSISSSSSSSFFTIRNFSKKKKKKMSVEKSWGATELLPLRFVRLNFISATFLVYYFRLWKSVLSFFSFLLSKESNKADLIAEEFLRR